MASLKSLSAISLRFGVDSKCAGLHVLRQLRGPKLAESNPECKVTQEIVRDATAASLHMKFTDGKEETVDITNLNARQVFAHIRSRIEEKDMATVLTQNNFVGQKLESRWGVRGQADTA